MASYLGRLKKTELLILAEHARVEDIDGLLKEELADALNEHLKKNASTFANDPVFKDYFSRASPTKRASGASAAAAPEGELKVKKKRAPRVKEETDAYASFSWPGFERIANVASSEGASASSPAPAATPAPARHLAPARTPSAVTHSILKTVPPSPSVITDAIEQKTREFSTTLDRALVKANAQHYVHDVRELLSSVVGIETLILLIESFSLQTRLIPSRHAFNVPSNDTLGTDTYPVHLPDFFVLLRSYYWSATFLWSLMSFWLPLSTSWLFNLTMRPVKSAGQTYMKPKWRCDPLTFNLAKALLTWLVFGEHRVRFFGLFSDTTVRAVQNAMPAGQTGVFVGSAIGLLISLYDAAQRK